MEAEMEPNSYYVEAHNKIAASQACLEAKEALLIKFKLITFAMNAELPPPYMRVEQIGKSSQTPSLNQSLPYLWPFQISTHQVVGITGIP